MTVHALVGVSLARRKEAGDILAFQQRGHVPRKEFFPDSEIPRRHFAADVQPVLQNQTRFAKLKAHGHVRANAVLKRLARQAVQARGNIRGKHPAAQAAIPVDAPDDFRGGSLRRAGQARAEQSVHPNARRSRVFQLVRRENFHARLSGPPKIFHAVRRSGLGKQHRPGASARHGVHSGAGQAVSAVSAGSACRQQRPSVSQAPKNFSRQFGRRPFHQCNGRDARFLKVALLHGPHGLGRDAVPHSQCASPHFRAKFDVLLNIIAQLRPFGEMSLKPAEELSILFLALCGLRRCNLDGYISQRRYTTCR